MSSILEKLRMIKSTRFLIKRCQRKFFINFFRSKSFLIVVDIGAGLSPYRRHIVCDKYIAIDREDREGMGEVVIGTADAVPIEDNFADLVILSEVLEHLEEPAIALKEAYRILKPGGIIVLSTPLTWPLHEVPRDFYRYTKFGIHYLLEKTGFRDLTINASNRYAMTVLQLFVAPMRGKKIYIPFIMLCNIIGAGLNNISSNEDMPLGYFVIAYK